MKDIEILSKKIDGYIKLRDWDKSKLIMTYNMLCNLSEESGEIWNVIKWLNNEKDFKKVIKANHEELKDGIGDLLWCVQRLASAFEVDMYESLEERLEEYEKRFPVEKVKGKKSNPTLGGYDAKYVK